MAPTGFEPATPGLKGQCSTRLSYGAVINKIKKENSYLNLDNLLK